MTEINAHGITVEVPSGWEGRIFRRNAAGEGSVRASEVPGPDAPAGELTFPLAQLSTVPLPVDAADYGSDVVETLAGGDVFIVLKEFQPEEAAQPLFQRAGLPHELDAEGFHPGTLQRTLPGQAGQQIFFNEGGRAFCLYVVIGDYRARQQLIGAVNAVLAGMQIEPRSEGAP